MPATVPDRDRNREPDQRARVLRPAYHAELSQLRLQVELMAVRVDQNLERMRLTLQTGDLGVAHEALAADDDIDAMSVSLTERCYDLLAREQPVASDLRFVVSVLRVLGEFERVGDLALRVVNLAPHHEILRGNPSTFELLIVLADAAIERYRDAMRAWSGLSEKLARELLESPSLPGQLEERLTRELLALDGSDAASVAIHTLVAGRSLERIADHAGIIGSRLLFLVTGDSGHLANEVR